MRSLLALALGATLVAAQHDPYARLSKPPLRSNLDDLEAGLEQYLPGTSYTVSQWSNTYIPSECRDIARNERRNLADFNVYNIKYSDCGDPWVFCHDKNSGITIQSMASQFGKLPVQMRDYVKHVITLSDRAGHAYMSGSNIAFFRPVNNMMGAIVHETGHSLDLNKAYGEQLSRSDNWWSKYNRDSNVPDPYAQTNAIEDVAQSHTVAVYNEAVPDKFRGRESRWQNIFNQYATVITVAREHGRGSSIITARPGQQCQRRFKSSSPVPKNSAVSVDEYEAPPNVTLQFATPFDFPASTQSTKGNCSLHW